MVRVIPLLLALVGALLLAAPPAEVHAASRSKPRIHKVYKGQHLGMIARRYNVTVEAIRHANDLERGKPIRPGQRLVIPPRDDPSGSRTRADRRRRAEAASPSSGRADSRPSGASGTKPLRVHTVRRGQCLSSIAQRYGVRSAALRGANGLRHGEPIRPGQKLVIPTVDDRDGSRARAQYRASARSSKAPKAPRSKKTATARRKKEPSWHRYRKPAWRRGYVTLVRHDERWQGYVIGKGGRVLPAARKAFAKMLATSDGREIKLSRRLISLVTKTSDTFGGRPIQVVSGYRAEGASAGSRHRRGQAIDFSIVGVPNAALRDYLKTFSKVGVGYYPNSSFVHLDVRERWTYWVDYSGPGQAPRYGGFWTQPSARR